MILLKAGLKYLQTLSENDRDFISKNILQNKFTIGLNGLFVTHLNKKKQKVLILIFKSNQLYFY